jgi:hypothetical protein
MTEKTCQPTTASTAALSLPFGQLEHAESNQAASSQSESTIALQALGLKLAEWNLQAASAANAAAGRSGKLHDDPSPIALPENYNPDAASHHLVRFHSLCIS